MLEKKYVYQVILDWATQDDSSVETEVFDTYEKALNHFHKLIDNELNPEISWVGSDAFDENKNLNEDYEFDCNLDASNKTDLWWNIYEKGYCDIKHTFIDLRKKELH